jgi:hypothetical protein
MILLQGLGLGLVAFGVAELSLPHGRLDPGSHDMMLGQRLGLVYTPAVGAWLGWLQRSRNRVVAGAVAGLAIAGIYFVLCMRRDFLAIMVAFPALLGGGLAALVGSNRSHGIGGFFGRLAKGLVAGLVLGRLYVPAECHPRYSCSSAASFRPGVCVRNVEGRFARHGNRKRSFSLPLEMGRRVGPSAP